MNIWIEGWKDERVDGWVGWWRVGWWMDAWVNEWAVDG